MERKNSLQRRTQTTQKKKKRENKSIKFEQLRTVSKTWPVRLLKERSLKRTWINFFTNKKKIKKKMNKISK